MFSEVYLFQIMRTPLVSTGSSINYFNSYIVSLWSTPRGALNNSFFLRGSCSPMSNASFSWQKRANFSCGRFRTPAIGNDTYVPTKEHYIHFPKNKCNERKGLAESYTTIACFCFETLLSKN